jgi:nucleotide-binding universal stress UspA family protein
MSSTTISNVNATTANAKIITTFSKILVAIDGSEESMDAVDYAISLSKEYNAELYALHVIRADVDLLGVYETSEYMTKMRNEAEKYLDKVRLKANEKNFQIKTEIISYANIAAGIIDYSEQNNFKLIVIGTRGSSGFKNYYSVVLQNML